MKLFLNGIEISRYALVTDAPISAGAHYWNECLKAYGYPPLPIISPEERTEDGYYLLLGRVAKEIIGSLRYNTYRIQRVGNSVAFSVNNPYFTETYPMRKLLQEVWREDDRWLVVIDELQGVLPYAYAGHELPDREGIDGLTTTYQTPWFSSYDLTTEEQIEAERKGADSGQVTISYAISPHQPDIHLLSTDVCGILKSVDRGNTWYHNNSHLYHLCCPYIIFDPYRPGCVWALNGFDTGAGRSSPDIVEGLGLYRSDDNGDSWELEYPLQCIRDTISGRMIEFGPQQEDGSYDMYILSSYGAGLHKKSKDGSWSCLGFTGTILHDMQYWQNRLYLTTDSEGLLVSDDDGKTWTSLNQTLLEGIITTFALHDSEAQIINAIANNKLWLTEDGGQHWNVVYEVESGTLSALRLSAANAEGRRHLYLTVNGANFCVRVSNDYGKTVALNQNSPLLRFNLGQDDGFFTPGFAPDPHDSEVIFACFAEVYRSDDGGIHYQAIGKNFTGASADEISFTEDGQINISFIDVGMGFSLSGYEGKYPPFDVYGRIRERGGRGCHHHAVDPYNSHHVIFQLHGHYNQTCLYESFDLGKTAKRLDDTLMSNGAIRFHRSRPGYLYGGQFYSTDNGKTWNKREREVSAIFDGNHDICLNWSKDGIYLSYDCGETWKQISSDVCNSRAVFDRRTHDIVWLLRKDSTVAKLELSQNRLTIYGPEQGIISRGKKPLLVTWFDQHPMDPDHLIIATRYPGPHECCSLPFESYDGGETWHPIEGYRHHAGFSATVAFHPTRNEAFIGSHHGTGILHCDVYKHIFYPEIYDEKT